MLALQRARLVTFENHQRIVLQNFHEYIKTKVLEDKSIRLSTETILFGLSGQRRRLVTGVALVQLSLSNSTNPQFMLTVGIRYNRTQARKYLAFNSEELMRQLFEEMHVEKVFVDPNIPKPKELEDEDPDIK